MTPKPCSEFFVASSQKDGGAYRYRLYDNGEAELLCKISMPSPMFLSLSENSLWAVLRAPFEDGKESGFAAYDIESGSALLPVNSTKGTVGCHIAVQNGVAYCANYGSGSIFKAPSTLAPHKGKGTDPTRQSSPHAHAVGFSLDGTYLLAADLGLDTVFVYDLDLTPVSRARVPCGMGARHFVFSRDGKYLYCANEMGGSVSVFAWNAPHLTLLSTVCVLPREHTGLGSCAAIKLSKSGEYLYVTERMTESIVTLRADGEHLSVLARTDSHGKEPRDFTLLADDRFAVCTNQFADSVSVYSVDGGIPRYLISFSLPSPLCAVELFTEKAPSKEHRPTKKA